MLSDATDDNPIRNRDRAGRTGELRPLNPTDSARARARADGRADGRAGEFFADKVEIHLPLTVRTRR